MPFCLASGAAFGLMAVFGKLAYDEGATVGTLLSVRFALSALVLAAVGARPLTRLSRRDVATGLGLGAVGYAAPAGCYFAALARIDAGLLSLLLYTFPAIVAVAAVALGRERLEARRVTALAVATTGLALVVGGGGALDPLGTSLGLAAALLYSAYILVSDAITIRPLPLAALVCTGAALTLTTASALAGELRPADLTPAGWGWIAALALVSTVGAIGLFFAGLRRTSPTTASILAAVEPLVTVAGAWAAFGERLTPAQLAGGACVLAAVLVLQAQWVPWRGRSRSSPITGSPTSSPASSAP